MPGVADDREDRRVLLDGVNYAEVAGLAALRPDSAASHKEDLSTEAMLCGESAACRC